MKKGVVYITDNNADSYLLEVCRKNLLRCVDGLDLVSVSQQPLDFGKNIVISGLDREPYSIFKQILTGIESTDADFIFIAEHDILYHPSHFEFIHPKKTRIFYNTNRWAIDPVQTSPTYGLAVFYYTNTTSFLCGYRDRLTALFSKGIEILEKNRGRIRDGCIPPKDIPHNERRKFRFIRWSSEYPCLDIRHESTYTPKNMVKRDKIGGKLYGWEERYELPFWGTFKPWPEFLRRVYNGEMYRR